MISNYFFEVEDSAAGHGHLEVREN